MKNKKRVHIAIGAVVLYLLMLVVLTAVESRNPDSSIHSFGDALWYSIITVTTVGYGDMAPVTGIGKLIGVVFALCSIGLLTALISLGIRLIVGEAFPRYKLRSARRKNWYWFSAETPDSEALAKAIHEDDPECIMIFPGEEGYNIGAGVVKLAVRPEELLKIRGDVKGLSLFYTGEDQWDNAAQAIQAAPLRANIYCLTDCTEEQLPENLRLFSRAEVLSRSYWKKFPLKENERRVVLIGCGEYGSELLTRALLTNVYDRDRVIEYHVFGDTHEYVALHPEIVAALTPDNPDEDDLFFHEGDWTSSPELLTAADRVILCEDNDQDNLSIYSQLRRWFAVPGSVHVRLDAEVPGIYSFGSREEIMTPEFVMKDAVNKMAVAINDIYNENTSAPVAWKDLSEFLKQSNIAAADHLPVKVRWLLGDDAGDIDQENCRKAFEVFCNADEAKRETCREMEHRRWLRFYRMYNWKAADTKDKMLRLHMSMLPYDQLDKAEQKKDDYAWEMLGKIADKA